MAKTALVVSGGGSKGAFAVGVIKQLAQEFPDINFDILVGTSTGALVVPFVALDELDLLEQLYTTVKTEDIILEGNLGYNLVNENSLFDSEPLGNLITEHLDDNRCQQIFALNKVIYLATTCLQTKKVVYFTNKEPDLVTEYEVLKMDIPWEIRAAVMASASQPVFMSPIEVKEGNIPLRQYVDGGVREYAGLQLAIDAGAEEIYVILLSTANSDVDNTPFGKAIKILKQTMDIFITDVGENDLRGPAIYNRALRYIDAVKNKMKADGLSNADIDQYFNIPFHDLFKNKKPLKIHVIRPSDGLGGGPGGLVFNPNEMKGMLAKGKQSISQYMASLSPDGSGNV